jgi:hypothetical protein
MNYAVEVNSGGMTYIRPFMTIGLCIQVALMTQTEKLQCWCY